MNNRPVRVLLAEANAAESDLISAFLQVPTENSVKLELERVSTLSDAIQAIKRSNIDVILLDLNLEDSLGIETFLSIRSHLNNTPVVILTSQEDSTSASEAVRAGAHTSVLKRRMDVNRLHVAVQYAMERSRRELAEIELASAGLIQSTILSAERPSIDGIEIAAHCEPARTVGGDFYDFVRLDDGKLSMVLGDVSGHGFASAMLMAETRGIFRSVARREADPGRLLTEINSLISQDCVRGAFITMFAAVICPDSRTLCFATAGHEGYLLSSKQTPKQRLACSAPPLGILPDHEFTTAEAIVLRPYDVVFACTDGLADSYCTLREDFFGMDGIFSTLSDAHDSADIMIDKLFQAAKEFEEVNLDDMTAIIARTTFT